MATVNTQFHTGNRVGSGQERFPAQNPVSQSHSSESRPSRDSPVVSVDNHAVGFRTSSAKNDDAQDDRKKYLTAKYPQHQMRLIRKRLEVEDWIDTQLKSLYDVIEETDTYDCEIDMDELLDLEEESERRRFVWERLTNLRKSRAVVSQFVEELLQKATTL